MPRLKAVIISITNVICAQNQPPPKERSEIIRLIRFVKSKGLKVVVLSNREWISTNKDGTKTPFSDFLDSKCGKIEWFIANRDGFPPKPQKAAVEHVLNSLGLEENEVIYIGNTEQDMRVAVNGGLLFLNATWITKTVEYGLFFDTPKDIAKFIDIFCIREHLWFFKIADDEVRFCAIAPYSTFKHEFAIYSVDAKTTLKFRYGHEDFWAKYLCSSIYFSGLYKELNYIAPYPGHDATHKRPPLKEQMTAFAKCFRITYLEDLLVRHATATKSASARSSGYGATLDHLNQLNTIHANQYPTKENGSPYKKFPLTSNKTVLVYDDFCTKGYSLESARNYIQQTGGKVVLSSWLKTINTNYCKLNIKKKFNPFIINKFTNTDISLKEYTYAGSIVDRAAPVELGERFTQYDSWDWPV